MRPTTRRDVLGWMVTISALPLLGNRLATSAGDATEWISLSAAMPYPLEAARAIGLAYLKVAPDEEDPAILQRRIRTAISAVIEPGDSATSASLTRALGDQIRRDFAKGDIVAVRGWMLARTEARLCALMALMS